MRHVKTVLRLLPGSKMVPAEKLVLFCSSDAKGRTEDSSPPATVLCYQMPGINKAWFSFEKLLRLVSCLLGDCLVWQVAGWSEGTICCFCWVHTDFSLFSSTALLLPSAVGWLPWTRQKLACCKSKHQHRVGRQPTIAFLLMHNCLMCPWMALQLNMFL